MSPRSLHRALRNSTRLRWTLVGLALAALTGSPLALAASSSKKKSKPVTHASLLSGTRNPKKGSLTKATTITAKMPGYPLQLTNSGLSGGGVLISCSSIAGGTAAKRPPCLRAANLSTGSAFEFAFGGPLGGVFQVGNDINRDYPAARPFITNATGVATGLNADRVDGLHAQDIIDSAVARSSVQVGAQGPQGPAGPQGVAGPTGSQGPAGPAGTPLESNTATPAYSGSNSAFTGQHVVASLQSDPLASPPLATSGDGVDLLGGQQILALSPGYTYIVQVTVRAFADSANFDQTEKHYVTAGLFLNGTTAPKLTLWTPDVPADGFNAATTSDTVVIKPTGGTGQLTLKGIDHTDDTNSTPVAAGATVVVTQVNSITP